MSHPHQTASGPLSESPLVLTDVITEAGVLGHRVIFTYTSAALKPTAALIQNFEALITGHPLAPAEIEQKLAQRFRLLGPQGLVGMALAAIDMALWDALAQARGIRLSNHLWSETSAQLLCLTPTAHWLEYADWWNPIMAEPLQINDGMALIGNVIGTGVRWNQAAVARFSV